MLQNYKLFFVGIYWSIFSYQQFYQHKFIVLNNLLNNKTC